MTGTIFIYLKGRKGRKGARKIIKILPLVFLVARRVELVACAELVEVKHSW